MIIGAWNYPILLALHPVISAIAAGNTVVLKPSEIAHNTSRLLNEIVTNTFSPEFFTVFEGGPETAQTILDQRFDYIFYTGSKRVGKLVMQAAAQHLTPVTLELGGKSPAIIDQTANLDIASKRIAWGKFLNAGQTCVAPDYLLVEESIKEKLLGKIERAIPQFYGEDPSQNGDYPGIINESHFNRLVSLLENETNASDRQYDRKKLYIAPTILDNRSWDDPIMQEEIFGPILPVLTFSELDEITDKINARPTPLALYLFTSDKTAEQHVIRHIEFGGGCINDTVVHLGNLNLPFGGKGSSGMGSYHGKAGFDTFSYKKSILKKPTWIDIPYRYAPYNGKLKWLKKIFN